MSSVQVARAVRRQGSPVTHLVTETGSAHTLASTPEGLDVGGIGWTFGSVDRQGRKPLTRRDAQQARKLTFTHTVAQSMPANRRGRLVGPSPATVVNDLINLADSGKKVRLINTSTLEAKGWWYPSLQVRITRRTWHQEIAEAELSWTLTEVIDERPKIGKLPPPKPKPTPRPATHTGQPDYRVVAGDSLWKIAARKLGSGERWRELYNLNQKRLNLKPPEMYRGLLTVWIYPGMLLKIPAR